MATDGGENQRSRQLLENNPRGLAQQWLQCRESTALKEKLFNYWSNQVPAIYFLNEVDKEQDAKANVLLYSPLEWFICGGKDPKTTFKELKQSDDPPKLCGRVFKMGEPTYSCRDCAVDPTCVFCIDCFQKSAHTTHRYRMSTSGGGGFCDCGDAEAWKKHHSCEIHTVSHEQPTQSPLERLPSGFRTRAEMLFNIALNYAYDLSVWAQSDTLPTGLQPSTVNDTYCTMLFNDEVHTYDQVIDTLKKAIDCTHKEAVEFATVVDREGRSSVCNGNFRLCEQARSIIQRSTSRHGNKALKVHVMHTSVVAHQMFAMNLLSWLTEIMAHSDGLRQVLCLECMKPHQDKGKVLIENVMLVDSKLWKVARNQWHQLIMCSVLMDQGFKKQFAVLYTKNYAQLQRDFMQDDHDHAVSITSLSVQMFTVPTLSRMLIMEHDLLSVLLSTFSEFCGPIKRSEGKSSFEKTSLQQNFRRIQYTLIDVRYVLSTKPDEWEPKLREKFVQGITWLLELLSALQGMDAVTRQVGQHIEVEPEWETAFNLQIKIGSCVSMILDWCSTDRTVLVEVYRETMKRLTQISGPFRTAKRKIAGHESNCVVYDVATQPVSVHLPISRFLTGLHVHLQKHRVSYYSEGFLPNQPLSPSEMLEEPLRTQVMIAQVQAGMWRRNGYALLNQIYYYHNVRCQQEMQDRDIQMLQIGSSLMDSNEYIITLLNKFGLINAMKNQSDRDPSLEDSQKQIHIDMLTEEFLGLLIVILGERYTDGIGNVTYEDRVQREVIHQLCVGPMSHSELAKALPEDHNHETGLENVIATVATFKKPGATGKGLYELKQEYYSHFNPFFYHYSKSEQSKAEEAQRKRKKSSGDGDALPPPMPLSYTSAFKSISKLLQCDVLVYALATILRRACTSKIRGWTETMIQRVLYLIGMALQEEKLYHANNEDFGFVAKATSELPWQHNLKEGCLSCLNPSPGKTKGNPTLLGLLETLAKMQRVEEHKDLLAWILKTFAEVQQAKGRETTSVKVTKDLDAEEEKKRKAELAKQRRARIMAQMSAMQRNFIKENAELFEETSTELDSAAPMSVAMDTSEAALDVPIAVGANRSKPLEQGVSKCTCILCQEDQEVTLDGRAMVLAALVQRSTVLSKTRGKNITDSENFDPMFMPPDLYCGTHISTCGHIMHWDCWQRFFESVVAKEQRRPLRFRAHLSFDVDKNEFLCPLCESLSNAVIPLLPNSGSPTTPSQQSMEKPNDIEVSYNEWLEGIQSILQASQESAARQQEQQKEQESPEDGSLMDPCPLPSLTRMMAQTLADNFQLLFEYVYATPSQFSDSISEMIRIFARSTYVVGLGLMPHDEDPRVPLVAWTTCAYTIHAIENLLRDEGKPLFGALSSRQTDCLGALVRFAAVCGNVTNTTQCKKHALRLLSGLTGMDDPVNKLPCILEMDMFTLMVSICLSVPLLNCEDSRSVSTIHVSGEGINHQSVLQATLTAHIIQILLSASFTIDDTEMEQEDDNEAQQLLEIYKKLYTLTGVASTTTPSAWQLLFHVKKACLPFLRCAAMFFHFLNGIVSPATLHELGIDEFEPLCQYLAMPTNLTQLFDIETTPQMKVILERWCQHPDMKTKLSAEQQPALIRYPITVNQLISLPQDYSQLINTISLFMCPKSSGSDSRAPTLCLICGKTLCSQSYCCQNDIDGDIVGACMAHTFTCGAGVGIFLRVRECQLILLSGKNKGCFFTPPYLDDYGETDQGLRRGNPLHLCQDRYRKLQKLWLLHGVPEEIAHQLESNTSLLTIDWQNL
ncbi:E3 ubiquitin-protein ligase UBR2-like [Glandiceps talaboti]